MSGVNLLYIYLLIRLRFILQKFNYFIGDQQKNKKRKIDTQSPTNERKSNRINKQAGATLLSIPVFMIWLKKVLLNNNSMVINVIWLII